MIAGAFQLGDLPVRIASARVRPFIPDIERQLERGVAMAAIVAALKDRGIEITEQLGQGALPRSKGRRTTGARHDGKILSFLGRRVSTRCCGDAGIAVAFNGQTRSSGESYLPRPATCS